MDLFKNTTLALLTFTSVTVLAESGALKIHVTDASGQPIPSASAQITAADSITRKESETDENGDIKFVGLAPSEQYTLYIRADGYQPIKGNNILVVSGKSFQLNYSMQQEGSAIEEVTVLGTRIPMVDTTSAQVGQHITLDLTESLPTGRTFQSYLQLAPGTLPSTGGNPASKSGVNYSDVDGAGSSSDNIYYIDGIDITDVQSGTYGANVNSEIIQEMKVITGGVPAEMAGGSGLVSRVITKSGSNEFHGSVNYYTQNSDLVADNKHTQGSEYTTFDSAFTLGGPIIKDKLWFFASYQRKEREDDVVGLNGGDVLRSPTDEQSLGFGKLTWKPTEEDTVVATFFNDPSTRSGTRDPSILNNRDRARDSGGDNYKLQWKHSWENTALTLDAFQHSAELSDLAADESTSNDVATLGNSLSREQLFLGGRGLNRQEFRDKSSLSATFEWFLDSDWGSHDIKAGLAFIHNDRFLNQSYTGDGAQYDSISTLDTGATLDTYSGGDWQGSTGISNDDYTRILDGISASSAEDQAYFNGLLDNNNDGAISAEELGGLVFSSTAGNPNDQVNAYRIMETSTAPITLSQEGRTWFVQDKWSYDNWTVNAGVRFERWSHISSDGTTLFTFEEEPAPRISVVYDLFGDGKAKVWGFGGRYYDPLRTDMTSFAGSFSGPVREEQIFMGDRWLTFRTRGGRQVLDAEFAPSTKTPYTDEFMLGFSTGIGDDMSFEATFTRRTTEDLLEDYDLGVYTDPEQVGEFALPLSYFGYDQQPENVNYVIATLEGGKREYQGAEFVFRKLKTDNWQALVSYTYNDQKGNSNSDGNADLQGDFLWLDPRAPNMWGDQPGSIEHIFKVAGSYEFENGINVGMVYNWNSGALYSRTSNVYRRHAPLREEDAYEYRGATSRWVQDGVIASEKAPSYGTLDLSVRYTKKIFDLETEFFIQAFNVLDDQAATRVMDFDAGEGDIAFGDATEWVAPRRFYIGTRVSF